MSSIHISAASWQMNKGEHWIEGAAVLSEPGLSDVITFIMPNGKPYTGEVWDYRLWPYRGAITIPAGVDLPEESLGEREDAAANER